MGDVAETQSQGPLLADTPEESIRPKKPHSLSKVPKGARKPKGGSANGQQNVQDEGQPLDVKVQKRKTRSKEKPLQENTISSSLKLEKTHRSKAAKEESDGGSGGLKAEQPKGHQDKAESTLSSSPLTAEVKSSRGVKNAMDIAAGSGHSAHYLGSEPVTKGNRLPKDERLYVPWNENKAVKEEPLRSETSCSGTSEEEVENKRISDVNEEEVPGNFKEAEKPENKEKVLTSSGEEEEDAMGKRKSHTRREANAERESGGKKCAGKQRKRKAKDSQDDDMERCAKRRKGDSPRSVSPKGTRKRRSKCEDGAVEKKRRKGAEEGRRGKANAEEAQKWKWWEEEKREDGVKWHRLEHKGPYFAPPYEPLPACVNFYYNGKPVKLSPAAEEVATFFAKMLDHEYTRKEIFRRNFFNDWTKEMTPNEQKKIKDLKKCDFSEIHQYFVDKQEARKSLSKEEKQKLKEEAEKIQEEYGYCIIDGHREKIGNFKTEPPGLFRGRGDHPKMGMVKKRIMPEDVIINCSKDSKIPKPPRGHKWKEVRCDNTVTWLASWTENIQGAIKYIMLNPSSKLKGEKDWQKYEVARRLKGVVDKIRRQYRADWKSKEMKKRQIAVALYFIDKLALRAGNEKEEGETADTVGCCSLRVEHITLHPRLDGKQNVVEFDFLGKDCIRYYNNVPVEKQVYKNLQLFMENKDPGDNLFDRLTTTSLNKHLQDLMDGLTAKVFRTYNASITLQEQLDALTNEDDSVAAKLLSYNRANRAVAILCNHQRATPKTFEKSMKNLQAKIDAKVEQLKDAEKELKRAKKEHKCKKDMKSKTTVEKKKKMVEKIEDQLAKLNMQATDKEENKQIALGTSKLNYLDPRISVAWCKRFDVPIEKIYNKTQREKFAWAIAMADEDFEF